MYIICFYVDEHNSNRFKRKGNNYAVSKILPGNLSMHSCYTPVVTVYG